MAIMIGKESPVLPGDVDGVGELLVVLTGLLVMETISVMVTYGNDKNVMNAALMPLLFNIPQLAHQGNGKSWGGGEEGRKRR